MGGGGGGFFGTLLNVVSIAVPVLRPVAMVYNTINAVQSGNPLALASSALGWSNYMGGMGNAVGSVDSSGWSSNDFNGLNDAFTPASSVDYGALAAQDFADFGTEGVSALGGSLGYAQGLDYASPFATGFDIAQANLPYTATPEEFFKGTTGYQDLQSQIATDPNAAAKNVVDFSKYSGIIAGSEDVARSTLNSLYDPTRYDTSNLRGLLNINTEGGYQAANQLLGEGGAMSLANMQSFGSAGQGLEQFAQSGPAAALGSNQVSAFTSPTTSTFGEGYDMGPYSPEVMNVPEAPKIPTVDVTGSNYENPFSVASGTTPSSEWGAPKTWESGDLSQPAQGVTPMMEPAYSPSTDISIGEGMTTAGGPAATGGNFMTTLSDMFKNRGVQAGAKPMGPWEMGLTGAAGLYQDINQRNMMKQMRGMYDQAMAGADQFAAERGLASQKWQEGARDPSVAYNEYIRGGGGLAMQQAAAKAAKAGRRNILPQLESQMRMQAMSEFYPQYMKMFNPNQFAGQQAQVASQFAGPMANLQAQRGMGTFGALGNIFKRQGW